MESVVKAIIRTVLLVAAILVLSQFIPLLAAHEGAALVAAVALGLFGVIARIFLALLLIVAVVLLFHPFF